MGTTLDYVARGNQTSFYTRPLHGANIGAAAIASVGSGLKAGLRASFAPLSGDCTGTMILAVCDELVYLVNGRFRVVGGEHGVVIFLEQGSEFLRVVIVIAVELGEVIDEFAFAVCGVAGDILIVGLDEAFAGHGKTVVFPVFALPVPCNICPF